MTTFTDSVFDISCYGGNNGMITITASGGMGPYQYSIDGGSTWQASSIFTGLTSATYTLVVQDVNNILSTPQSAFVNQPNAIIYNQSYTICAGDFIVVSFNVYTHTGVYTDIMQAWNGCDSTIITNITTHYGDVSVTATSNTLTSNATGVTYEWKDCSNLFSSISGATAQSYTPTFAGNYCVVITDIALGCLDTSACYYISPSVGIPDSNMSDAISISPNPFSSQTTLMFAEEPTNTTIRIINPLGQCVKEFAPLKGSNEVIIDKGKMKPGIYFVQITDEMKNVVNRKIVVQ